MKKEKKYPMFVYGTLLSKERRESLGVFADDVREAKLKGYRKEGLNIVESDDNTVDGLFFSVDTDELASLDRYEGLPTLYHRMAVSVIVEGIDEVAYVYQLN